MRTTTTALATATIAVLLTAAPAQAADLRPPSRPQSVAIFGGDGGDRVRVGWIEPARTGSHPIRRYVIRWKGGRLVVPARAGNEVRIGKLEKGRYVFRVKAVSRAGAGPWARTPVMYAL
jgi:hypothetical protein